MGFGEERAVSCGTLVVEVESASARSTFFVLYGDRPNYCRSLGGDFFSLDLVGKIEAYPRLVLTITGI